MAAYLLTWNPRRFHTWDELTWLDEEKHSDWSCGSRLSMEVGSRVYLFKQGSAPRGIVASGRTTSDVFQRKHWDPTRASKREKANYVDVRFDVVLLDEAFPAHEIKTLSAINWRTQMSGIRIPDEVAGELERRWAAFAKLGKAAELHRQIRAVENTLTEVRTYVRGRDRRLRDRALQMAGGVCAACKFHFGGFLQGLGQRVLQVHHQRQLSASDRPRITTLKDLVVLCANCHAMVHADPRRAMTVETLRRRLALA